jgi:hypothetical protein
VKLQFPSKKAKHLIEYTQLHSFEPENRSWQHHHLVKQPEVPRKSYYLYVRQNVKGKIVEDSKRTWRLITFSRIVPYLQTNKQIIKAIEQSYHQAITNKHVSRARYGCSPPLQINLSSSFVLSENYFKFDQVYKKMYEHLQHQISFIRFIIGYIFILCTLEVVDIIILAHFSVD